MAKFLALLALLLFNACTYQRAIKQTGVQSISYGSGGGFTGAVVSYSLSLDGQLSKTENNSTMPVKVIGTKNVKALFEEAAGLKDYTFNEPGNMYSFITIKTDTQSRYISWGMGSDRIDSRVTELYGQLMALTK